MAAKVIANNGTALAASSTPAGLVKKNRVPRTAADKVPVNGTEAPRVPAAAPPADGPAAPKHKLVRDSFTIPKNEYLVLAGLKERATQLRRPTKKSELLRAGVAALQAMNDRAFLAALARIPSLKTGRPKDDTNG